MPTPLRDRRAGRRLLLAVVALAATAVAVAGAAGEDADREDTDAPKQTPKAETGGVSAP